ncbi:MAG: hypothetical protein PUB18_04935 [bacterium]|nr:hypothetical protein [bacterium]
MEQKHKQIGLEILIGVLITIIIGLSVYMIYDKVLSKNDKENIVQNNNTINNEDNSNTKNEQSNHVNEDSNLNENTTTQQILISHNLIQRKRQ